MIPKWYYAFLIKCTIIETYSIKWYNLTKGYTKEGSDSICKALMKKMNTIGF